MGQNITAKVQVIYENKGSYTIRVNSRADPVASYTGDIPGYKVELEQEEGNTEQEERNTDEDSNELITVIKFTVEPK